MASGGEEALARVLAAATVSLAAGADPHDTAAKIWPDFKEAVGAAQDELRAQELEGVDRWHQARHGANRLEPEG